MTERKANQAAKAQTAGDRITAVYVRVSTDAQFEEGYSIDAQEEKLRQWCRLKDYTNVEVYQDGGWSGSNLDRPAMKKLISDITCRRVGRVVVYKLDRLSRSQKDTLFLLEEVFIPYDVEFYSLNENFDTSTPYGKAMIGILSVFAQLERENIRERTRMGMYERVKSGYWMGGNSTPFGYDYDANRNTLVPNEHAAEVRQIFDLYLQGYSTTRLAKLFPVSSDRQIMQILGRITYTGKIQYNNEIFPGRHEPLIDETTFDRVQKEIKRRSARSTTHSPHLLTGLLVCGKCGAKMRYQKWSGGAVKIYCYSQQTSKPNLVKDPNCNNSRIDAGQLERLVLDDLFKMTDSISAKPLPNPENPPDRQAALKSLRQKHDALAAKIKRLYNLYAENPNDILKSTIEENQSCLSEVAEMLFNEKASFDAVNDIAERNREVRNLRNRWDALTVREKQRALRICINRIVITDDKVDIEYLL